MLHLLQHIGQIGHVGTIDLRGLPLGIWLHDLRNLFIPIKLQVDSFAANLCELNAFNEQKLPVTAARICRFSAVRHTFNASDMFGTEEPSNPEERVGWTSFMDCYQRQDQRRGGVGVRASKCEC